MSFSKAISLAVLAGAVQLWWGRSGRPFLSRKISSTPRSPKSLRRALGSGVARCGQPDAEHQHQTRPAWPQHPCMFPCLPTPRSLKPPSASS